MAGVGLGGFFNGDPNPNPFTDILPPGGALLDSNGQPIVDDSAIDSNSFADDEGYDPPTGNGLSTVSFSREKPFPVVKKYEYAQSYGASKLDVLKGIEEEIRDLLLARRTILSELKSEQEEVTKRLKIADTVSTTLDEMFPEDKTEPDDVVYLDRQSDWK